jgi:hypothetical protein
MARMRREQRFVCGWFMRNPVEAEAGGPAEPSLLRAFRAGLGIACRLALAAQRAHAHPPESLNLRGAGVKTSL